jgi:hypothetical protein
MPRIAGLHILERLMDSDPEYWAAEIATLATQPAPPDRKCLKALLRPTLGLDPNELLKDRFLCKGGTLLFAGPTGVGKSSLTMQALILWALGKPLFGIQPSRALKSLLIQAENDEGDLAEMRDGVLHGLSLPPDETSQALEGVEVITEDSTSGEAFAPFLDAALGAKAVDLVAVDPVFAYLGGDSSSQKDVTPWLRNKLLPIIHKHNVGLILIHHTNKPRMGEEKGTWQAGDFAYLGAGSAEWANFARCVIALRSLGSASIFELVAGKRGRRLGWVDAHGQHTEAQHVAHAIEPGRIYWRSPTPDEVNNETGGTAGDQLRMVVATVHDLCSVLSDAKACQLDVISEVKGEIARSTAQRLIAKGIKLGMLEKVEINQAHVGHKKAFIRCTEKGKSMLGITL